MSLSPHPLARPLRDVLDEWRWVERRLGDVDPDSIDRPVLRRRYEELRAEYLRTTDIVTRRIRVAERRRPAEH